MDLCSLILAKGANASFLEMLLCSFDLSSILYIAYGMLLSGFVGSMIISPTMNYIFDSSTKQKDAHKEAMCVGIIERMFYTLMIITSNQVLIGGWLLLKAFSRFDRTGNNIKEFHIYLLGNISSLLIGVIFGFGTLYFMLHLS